MLTKSYPLDRAEWLRACYELPPSECNVLVGFEIVGVQA
jgi:hypothetical protein